MTPDTSPRFENEHVLGRPIASAAMKVRLTRKYADVIDGVDLSNVRTGETLDLPAREARLLLAEGWAEYAGGRRSRATANESTFSRKRSRHSIKR
jgi:hypothetical protein